jgi:GT2 family glycosyltransferase
MKIAIITVNYHNPEETISCIKSIKNSRNDNLSSYYYVVDNGGSKESTSGIANKLPGTFVINSPKNLGFAGGCNLALKRAFKKDVDFVLLINPDAVIESKNFLLKMILTGADLVAPLIRYSKNGIQTFDHGGKIDYLFGRNTHLTSIYKRPISGSPDYFTGACLLIRTTVFKKIGLLDDGFFLYYEDADFCLRAVKAGFVQRICREAEIFHHLSTTTSKMGKRKITILANSHLRFCQKHLPYFSIPLYLVFNLYLRTKALLL